MNDTTSKAKTEAEDSSALLPSYIEKIHASYQETGRQVDRWANLGLFLSCLVVLSATNIVAIQGQVTLSGLNISADRSFLLLVGQSLLFLSYLALFAYTLHHDRLYRLIRGFYWKVHLHADGTVPNKLWHVPPYAFPSSMLVIHAAIRATKYWTDDGDMDKYGTTEFGSIAKFFVERLMMLLFLVLLIFFPLAGSIIVTTSLWITSSSYWMPGVSTAIAISHLVLTGVSVLSERK